jgi:hypothetical protein
LEEKRHFSLSRWTNMAMSTTKPVNQRMGKGITPDTNACVLLWKVMGPRPEGGNGMPALYFELLGCPEPPDQGEYFLSLSGHGKEISHLDQTSIEEVHQEAQKACQRPWREQDYPRIWAWLKASNRQLALVHEAVLRPKYFNPLVCPTRDNEPGMLVGALLPNVQKCRELATALTARAMLRTGKGEYDLAWQDLLACHRLGRHVSRGATPIELLVGIAIEQVATNADLAFLERAPLTSQQFRERIRDLQNLPPLSDAADKIGFTERLTYLQVMQLVKRYGPSKMDDVSTGSTSASGLVERVAMALVDWKPILENANAWYDRIEGAVRIKDRASRKLELDKIVADLQESKRQATQGGGFPTGRKISEVLLGLQLPALLKVQDAYERSQQVQENLLVAFALAAYKKDTGHYPAQLADLAPMYLTAAPLDSFSGKPLIYSHTPDSYFFYSVGVNGIDEEGRSFDDDPAGDDLPVRMPLPAVKE